MAAANGIGALADTRFIQKPTKIPEDRAKWAEWRSQFENFMGCVEAQYPEEMFLAANNPDPLDMTTYGTETVRRARTLYAIIASLASSSVLPVCKAHQRTRNGFEVWRLMIKDREPKTDGRRLMLLCELVAGKLLNGAKSKDVLQKLITWETSLAEYEAMGTPMADELTRGVLLKNAPEQIATHLHINITTLPDYLTMRTAIESFLTARNQWVGISTAASSNQGYAPMDIRAIGGGVVCHNCGRPGHTKQNCWREGGGAYVAGSGKTVDSKGKTKGDQKGKGWKGDQKGKGKGYQKGKMKRWRFTNKRRVERRSEGS